MRTIVNGIFTKIFNIYYQKLLQESNMCRIQLLSYVHLKNHSDGSLRKLRLL